MLGHISESGRNGSLTTTRLSPWQCRMVILVVQVTGQQRYGNAMLRILNLDIKTIKLAETTINIKTKTGFGFSSLEKQML